MNGIGANVASRLTALGGRTGKSVDPEMKTISELMYPAGIFHLGLKPGFLPRNVAPKGCSSMESGTATLDFSDPKESKSLCLCNGAV